MNNLLDKFMTRKGLYAAFWIAGIFMVAVLIFFSARLSKEVPPLPASVKSASGQLLYTKDDIVKGKGYFQEFGLMGYGSLLGMGTYMGPDFTTDFLHDRVTSLYTQYGLEKFGTNTLTPEQKGFVKELVKKDVRGTKMLENGTIYSDKSAKAYLENKARLINFLVNGRKDWSYVGGVIKPTEAAKIAAFFDWSQLVASSLRPGKDTTWSNNWPYEPLIDQDMTYNANVVSLFEWLLLWPFSIIVLYLAYEYILKGEDKGPKDTLKVSSLFPSQQKLLKYIPTVALFACAQMVFGGYLAHLYASPDATLLLPQSVIPFNVMRQFHINLAILWIVIGWLVGGLFIAPLVSGKDLKYPWLVDALYIALLIVGVGGLIGMYLGTQGYLREIWFWFGSEGREYLELGRVWDIGLVVGLVAWFLMVYTTIKTTKSDLLVGTMIWSAFGIATLYIAGMMPLTKIFPNFTIDDYYRWWVVHLWVELTFELFAAGVTAYLAVALGLVQRVVAEKIMLFEILLIIATGVLGVGHHYWWQGADEYWVAFGGLASALEPLPLILLMIDALKERKGILAKGQDFPWSIAFLWLCGSSFLNWLGAGWMGMMINTPVVDYYAHGTYLIVPHAHASMLGAFGYIALAFIYLVARANALAKNLAWSDKPAKYAFWFLTIGVVLYCIPCIIIGLHQMKVAYELGYYAARLREALEPVKIWMWIRIMPDTMMIIGAAIAFFDLSYKLYFSKKIKAS